MAGGSFSDCRPLDEHDNAAITNCGRPAKSGYFVFNAVLVGAKPEADNHTGRAGLLVRRKWL